MILGLVFLWGAGAVEFPVGTSNGSRVFYLQKDGVGHIALLYPYSQSELITVETEFDSSRSGAPSGSPALPLARLRGFGLRPQPARRHRRLATLRFDSL